MAEQRFTNREITLMFDEIKDHLERNDEKSEQILTQVKFTNGKVKKLHLYLSIVGTSVVTLFLQDAQSLIHFITSIL
jgi:hypothetical protein